MRIPFTDNKGRTVMISDEMTLGDMLKLGVVVTMGNPKKPLKNDVYVHPPRKRKPRKSK